MGHTEAVPEQDVEKPPEDECSHVELLDPLVSLEHYSCFTHLKRITAWVRQFVHNCRHKDSRIVISLSC